MVEHQVRVSPASAELAAIRRFHVRARHVLLPERTRLRDFVTALSSSGLVPAMQEARKGLVDRLRPLAVQAPLLDQSQSQAEVLVDPSGERAILLRLSHTSPTRESRPTLIDAVLLSTSDTTSLEAAVTTAIPGDWADHSWVEARQIDRLTQSFGELSPNGKLLADPTIRAAARRLYDDGLRDAIRPIISAVGDAPVPREALEQLEAYKRDPSALAAILNDSEIALPHYMIFCSNCDTPHLTFTDRSRADGVINDCGRRCGTCREQQLGVLDTFAVREPYARALAQGLWLESLAGDVAAYRTDAVWTGQMVATYEVDVLTVFADRIVLIEAKDTSFGQNDLSVTAFKAQEVDAHVVVIVTTRDVHENVTDAVTKLSRATERREYRLIARASGDAIRAELLDVLDSLQARRLQRWLTAAPGRFYGGEVFATIEDD